MAQKRGRGKIFTVRAFFPLPLGVRAGARARQLVVFFVVARFAAPVGDALSPMECHSTMAMPPMFRVREREELMERMNAVKPRIWGERAERK
jgi:hypothetical protein